MKEDVEQDMSFASEIKEENRQIGEKITEVPG